MKVPNDTVKTENIAVINNASGVVVFGLYEAICGAGIAWHVSVLQVQPISATAAGAESPKGYRAGTGAPQPQNCKSHSQIYLVIH